MNIKFEIFKVYRHWVAKIWGLENQRLWQRLSTVTEFVLQKIFTFIIFLVTPYVMVNKQNTKFTRLCIVFKAIIYFC